MGERGISEAIARAVGPALLYATLGAMPLVAIDWASLLIGLPIAGSDSLGMLAYLASATCLHVAWLLVPVSLALWLLGRLRERDTAPGVTLAWVLSSLVALGGLRGIEFLLPSGQHMQFEAHVAWLRWSVHALTLLGAAALGRFVLTPLCTRAASARGVYAGVLGLVGVSCALTVVLAMAPVHLDRLSPPFVLLGGLCFALAGRAFLPPEGLPSLSPLFAAIGALVVLSLAYLGRDPHGRFLLFAHAPLSAPLARLARDLVDVDGDGAATTLLAGTDCAAFDEKRGPARRERAGDGVDQDCRGGDAPKRPRDEPSGMRVAQCNLDTPARSVVLITVDAMRADTLDGPATPALSQFARQVVRFDRAYSPATFTFKSLTSLLSMRTLSDHVDNPVTDPVETLPKTFAGALKGAGFRTGMVNPIELDPLLLVSFAELNKTESDPFDKFTAGRITDMGLEFVDRHVGERFLLWLHYPGAHAPYYSPEFAGANVATLSPYARALAYVDRQAGRFLSGLAQRNLAPTTAIFVSADHGEDLGEHGGHLGHGPDAYEAVLHVPLLAWIPGCAPARVSTPTSTLRLGATIGAATGIPIAGPTLLEGPGPGAPAIVSEALYDEGQFPPGTFLRAIIRGNDKLIVDVRNGGRVMFDLGDDPTESYDIYRSSDVVREELEGAYQRWLDRDAER